MLPMLSRANRLRIPLDWAAPHPDAEFPDVYFLIGRMNSGGTTSDNGLLMGTEICGRTEKMPIDELSDYFRKVLKPIDEIPFIVVPELIHFQQKYSTETTTLLSQSILERSSDFDMTREKWTVV